MSVYQKIKSYMEQRGMAVGEIAPKANLSECALAAILSGEITLYADDLRAICLALNVSPEAFVEE